ncbi:hypothetical protein QJQ45_012285 [Haematococcus lacustris]|nr:hypothetical protein QJQ45_012285 [Haematococcus lacustris]
MARRRAAEAEAKAQADAGAYEAQLHQLQADLQQREQQVADTQRLQHLQQQLQDLQQDELQRKEQQVAEQQQQLQQQQADMHLREQQLADQQHQVQQREQQVAQQQHQLQQQQADLQQREQQVAQQQHQLQQHQLYRLQQQLDAHSGAELQRQVPGSLRSSIFKRPRQDITLAPMPRLDEPQGAAASIAAAAVAAVLRAAAEAEAAGAAGGGGEGQGQQGGGQHGGIGKGARGQGGKGAATSSPPCTEQPLSPRPVWDLRSHRQQFLSNSPQAWQRKLQPLLNEFQKYPVEAGAGLLDRLQQHRRMRSVVSLATGVVPSTPDQVLGGIMVESLRPVLAGIKPAPGGQRSTNQQPFNTALIMTMGRGIEQHGIKRTARQLGITPLAEQLEYVRTFFEEHSSPSPMYKDVRHYYVRVTAGLWAHVTSVCNSDIEKCSPFESAALRRVSGEPVPMMAVAVREKLGQPGVQFENWEFEMKALLRQHGLGAVVKAPVGLEGNSRLGSVSAAAASPARPVGVATPAISPAAAVAAAATAAVAASLTPEQDEKAHAIICSSVDPNKYRALCNRHESARALWQALRSMHTQQVHASRQQLIIKAGRQSMQSGQSVQEYWAEAQDLHERINSTGAYSGTLCQALLGLPPDYQQLVQSILEQPLDEQLTFEQILPRLLLREQLLQNSQPHAVALAARSAGGRGRSGSRGPRDAGQGRGRGQARGGRGFQGECWQCHQRGHQAHQCPNRPVSPVPRSPSPSWRGDPSSRSSGAARPPTPGPGGGAASGWGSSVRGRDSSSPSRHPGSMSRSSIAYSVVSKPLLSGEWVIDSGCSRHLTPHRELLHDYQPLHEPHHIIVANGGRIEAQGQGVVCFEGAGGAMQLLDVLHVPEADGSLVSVGKATRAGGSVHFTPFGCSINMPGAKYSIRGTQVEQDLFLLDSKPVPVAGGFSLAARTCSDPLVLHHRLGHPGYRQLARLLREGMVRGTSVTAAQCEAAASELCEPCVMGKQTSLEARQHAGLGVTATRPLMLVHSDVCDVTGQYSAATPDGMRYFVSLLDEFSGLVAVVLIKHKSDAPAALRDMVTLLQRRLGHKVVYLRTDRGGEYIGAETQQWLRSEGITHQQTAPRTPTMNGSAERVNRTIMECVRAMMLASGVPAYFWGFGVMAAAHVHNLRPVAGKPCKPHEACFGSPPDIHHLRVWGCPAWVHDSEPSSKLASRGIKGVFVGYEEGGKAYQVWAEGRLYVSKSVVFDEQAVLRRFAPVSCAPAPSDLVAPPSAGAPKGGDSAAGEQPGKQGGMEQGRMGSGGGTPAVTPTVTPARHSANCGGGSSDSNSGGGMETGTPDTVPALRPALVPPERRRSERVRKRVEFPDFVTLCYSARYESNSSSGSEREGDGSRGSRGSRGSSGGAASQPAEPRSFSEAMSRPDAEEWGRAMDAEMASQHANQTWVLVSRQPGMSVLPGRWVLKVKWGSDGSIVKYKARWVVKGFRQRDGVDYFEDAVFAPVVMHTTQRLIFALAVQKGWGLWQIDFKTAFLNSKLTDSDPQIFVEQPEGYEVGKGLVCQLQRTVYGLKQAPRAWYMCRREQLEQIGFRASAADPSLFSLRTSSGSAVHMLVYVDDCILASADEAAVQEVKQQLQQAFDVHDLGQAADFLGMRIAFDRAAGILRLTQQQYIEQLLQRFGLAECNPRQLPLSPGTQLVKEGEQLSEQHTLRYRELVGGLLWLSTCTRPDIAFAVGQLTRYMQSPTREHEQAAQGVLRYLRGTAGQGLVFRGSCSGELVGFCDSDYASCKQSRRSTTGYVFILSGATVSVRSKLQTTVATSTTEAEYQAAADATREALFLRKLLHELCAVTGPIPILCDSQGAVALVKNPVESQRSKHIAVMHHMARERVWRGEVEFSYCPTADMVADALTKALPGPKFVSCKAGMGVG